MSSYNSTYYSWDILISNAGSTPYEEVPIGDSLKIIDIDYFSALSWIINYLSTWFPEPSPRFKDILVVDIVVDLLDPGAAYKSFPMSINLKFIDFLFPQLVSSPIFGMNNIPMTEFAFLISNTDAPFLMSTGGTRYNDSTQFSKETCRL